MGGYTSGTPKSYPGQLTIFSIFKKRHRASSIVRYPGKVEMLRDITTRRGWAGAVLLLHLGGLVLVAQTPIRVSVGNAAPLEYRDAAGQPQGFAVDVIREAAKRQ